MSLELPKTLIYPPKPKPGDKVAILSPSSGLPELYPHVYELGLRRLETIFQLVPVEYPTTRRMHSSPEDRARDIHAAFADPDIKAILCSIGGDDEIKVLKHLDPTLLAAHSKPFFGYSDNANLHLMLWNLGIVSYYGGSIMVQLGRGGAMHPYTVDSLRHALFEHASYDIVPAPNYTDEDLEWADPTTRRYEPAMFPGSDWIWHNADRVVEGTTWGGNLEILSWNLSASRYILPPEAYAGKILYIETSEEMPSSIEVYRMLMCMGERGLLHQFPAILVGRPKAWSFEHRHSPEEKAVYVAAQREAVLRAVAEYAPDALVVFGLDFGHTDPQCILPNGGHITIDGPRRTLTVTY